MKRLVPRSQRKLNRRPLTRRLRRPPGRPARPAAARRRPARRGCGGSRGRRRAPRREVAQVLVHPVGRQRRADPLAPPRLLGHLLAPYLGGVPVVVDVVVVEDHRGGDAGHQPPHFGVGPGVAVEPDVLVVADDLVIGPVRMVVAAPGHPAAVLRGELVGVDLVAEQQQGVGPLLRRLSGHAGGVGVQRVDAELAGLLGDDDLRIPAGPEDDPVPAGRLGTASAHETLGVRRHPRRPHPLPVDLHLVGVAGVGLEPGDGDDRVVVPAHLEGRRGAPEDRHRGGPVELHPHRRGGLPDVPQHGPENETHRVTLGRTGSAVAVLEHQHRRTPPPASHPKPVTPTSRSSCALR